MERKIVFYRTINDKCPLEDFFNTLPSKVIQKITWVLRLLIQLERIPSQYFCKMEGSDDIWECRVKQGSNIYRIFAFWDENQIVLTHGFIKKTQKTPPREIEKAQEYKKEYWRIKGVDKP